MRPPLHQKLVDKAVAAITAAVEVYNKPSFVYREETFAILALNAWELLLKAKVVKDAGNDLKSIRVYQARPTKSGEPSKKLCLKRNRAGNAQPISLGSCIVELDKTSSDTAPREPRQSSGRCRLPFRGGRAVAVEAGKVGAVHCFQGSGHEGR